MWKYFEEKTLKREVAVAGLVFLGFVVHRLFWVIKPEDIVQYQGIFGMVATGVFAFAAGAFGLDHFKKTK